MCILMGKLKTQEEFIEDAKRVHGDKYDYSEIKYTRSETKVKIYCKACEEYFYQTPNNHLAGKGCKKCSIKRSHDKAKLTSEEYIKRAKEVHGDKYDYSKLIYKGLSHKVEIYCKKCNKYFWQSADKHLLGQDCNCYKIEKIRKKRASTKEEFIRKANIIHKNGFDYSDVEYINVNTPVKIKCKKCGKLFLQTPGNHLAGKGCSYCKASKGEKIITDWLLNNKIVFIKQKRFKDCKDKQQLPFDFYLPEFNVCIEFQGKQHFVPFYFDITGEELQKRKLHDGIKRQYCKNNGIKLLEILYNENIENKLEEYLKHE